MPTTITMPQLGETVTEGTVAQWLKKVGDVVEKYESFVEVSTDKVNAEVPSPVSGTIRELIVSEGQTVPTGAPIAIIDERVAAGAAPHASPVAAVASGTAAAPPSSLHSVNGNGAPNGKPASNGNGSLRGASPAVRRLAREHAVDVGAIRGTGANGRVTARDVVAAASARGVGSLTIAAAPPAPSDASKRATDAAQMTGELVPLTAARRIIAQRMVESKHTAPHAWTMVEVDVTNVWKWRLRERDAFERAHGVKLTLLPFFMRAVVEALRAFPLMNASFTPDGIRLHQAINLGMAVALDGNLLVPVVRDAANLSITGLALAAGGIAARARAGKLGVDDLSGGTFTVNNTGANGSVLSAPILVSGQAGIVTMEAVVKRPVVRDDDAIAVRSMMNVCLSLDHRVVDGAVASGFLVDLKRRLEAMGPAGTL
jgi:2-oxoisovalerate dehydrogenase E2 component (dihydrolipoyl transacylase)